MENLMTAFSLAISFLMVSTGSLNSICIKWTQSIKADGVAFNHPFIQVFLMFLGQFLCLIAFFIICGYKNWMWNRIHIDDDSSSILNSSSDSTQCLPQFKLLVFLRLGFCDIIVVLFLFSGRNLTTLASFEMLTGTVIIFTGLLSVKILRCRFRPFEWLGIFFMVLGLVVVGVANMFYKYDMFNDQHFSFSGCLLIVMAQIIIAYRMVYEEKYLNTFNVPALFAVGLEGLVGMILLSVLMVPMYYIDCPLPFSTNPEGRLEDVFYFWKEIKEFPTIAVALMGAVISMAFLSFAGVTITKEYSAITRIVLDNMRFPCIWVASIQLFDEKFMFGQLTGFVVLLFGMDLYNDVVLGPTFRRSILPNLPVDHIITRCCASIYGIHHEAVDNESLLEDK